MKKLFLFLPVIFLSVVLFSACKKNDGDSVSTSSKIVGKWLFDKQYENEFFQGTFYKDTTYGGPGDYIEFKSNNTAFSDIAGDTSTIVYQLSGSQKIITWDPAKPALKDTSDIQTLTNSQFILHSKLAQGNDYDEFTIYLKK